MKALTLSRRALPALSAAFLLASRSSTRAEAAAVIAASATVVSAIIAFQKRGGSLALQFEALNVKLDTLLSNQRLLLDAISEVNASVNLVLRVASAVPEETVSLIHLRDVQKLYENLINLLSDLVTLKEAERAKAELRGYFRVLGDIAIHLRDDAASTNVSLNLAFACERAKAILFALREQTFVAGADLRLSLFRTCVYLEEALAAIAQPTGIRSHLVPIRATMGKVIKELEKHPLIGALPPKFSEISESTGSTMQAETTVCLKTKIGDEHLVSQTAIYGPPRNVRGESRDNAIGTARIYEQTTSFAYVGFRPRGTRIPNGRYLYEVDLVRPPISSTTGVPRRISRRTVYGRTTEAISELPAQFASCNYLALDEDQVPQSELLRFAELLGAYDALVAVESRVIAMQDAAVASRTEVAQVKETLRT